MHKHILARSVGLALLASGLLTACGEQGPAQQGPGAMPPAAVDVVTLHTAPLQLTTELTRGAIYWHFKNKEELFGSLWEELCQPLSHQLDACVSEQEPDPLGKLRSFLKGVIIKISTEPAHQQMFTILFNLESLEGEAISLREHMRSQSNNFFRDLEITLGNAVRLGQLPQELDLQRAATLLHCTLDGYIINWLHFPDRIDLRQEADFVLDNLFALIAQSGGPATSRT